jgi:cytochrome c
MAVAGAILAVGLAGAVSADMVGHGGAIRSVAVSDDGARVITASFDYSARIWRFDDQREVAVLEAHDAPVNDAVFLPGRAGAVTAGADGKIVHWNTETGLPKRVLQGHDGRVMALAASGDGRRIVSGGWDGRVILWDLAAASKLLEIGAGAAVNTVAFVDGDALVAAGDRDGGIRLWRLADSAVVGRFQAHALGVTGVVAGADGRRLLSIGRDDTARLWDLGRQSLISEYRSLPERNPIAADLSSAGDRLLLAYLDGSVVHIDADSGDILRVIRAGEGPVWGVTFAAAGRFALTAGADERVKIWHLETGDAIGVAHDDESLRPRPWLQSAHPGARLFRKCAGCHALTTDERQRSGPHFAGLFGRRAGSVDGYRYSRALVGTELVWGRETLSRLFELGPDRYLPGTKMPLQRIPNKAELENLIDYLEQITGRG